MGKKILYFGFNNHFGGAQRSMAEMFSRISDDVKIHVIDTYGSSNSYTQAILSGGCELSILYPDSRRTAIAYQGSNKMKRAMSILGAMPDMIKIGRRLKNKIREINPDLIMVSDLKSLNILAAARWFLKPPIVCYLRGNCLPEQVGRTARYIFSHWVARFIAVSTVTKKNLCRIGIPSQKIDVVFNPIDIEQIKRKADEALSYALPSEASIRLLLPATLIPGKGQICAIRTLRRLVDKGHDAILWIAGDIPPGSSSGYLAGIKAEIRRLDLQNRIFILGWRDDILAIMSKATIVILPSHSEGMPRTILEAMALKKPVVATPVGGVVNLIKDGETGLLFGIDKDEEAARAIERFSADDFASRITNNAQQFVRIHCHPRVHRTRLLKILEDIC